MPPCQPRPKRIVDPLQRELGGVHSHPYGDDPEPAPLGEAAEFVLQLIEVLVAPKSGRGLDLRVGRIRG